MTCFATSAFRLFQKGVTNIEFTSAKSSHGFAYSTHRRWRDCLGQASTWCIRSQSKGCVGQNPLCCSLRAQFTIPNRSGSGYRLQPPVPDRLKDALSNYGTDTRNIFPDDEDPAYVPEERRKKMVSDIISSTSHMRNYSKMDRLRAALDKVHDCPSVEHESWKELYLFLRTTEMCCEIIRFPKDVFPKGQKLWIELTECKEKRIPALLELPNGMVVVPVFSMEEYMDQFFSLVDAFESCWFPVPRMGSRYESFCAMPFPVAATGTLRCHSALATAALASCNIPPLGVLLNPGQRTSKFITYPEMVYLTEMMNRRVQDRVTDVVTPHSKKDSKKEVPKNGEREDVEEDEQKWEAIFPLGLMTTFNTQKMEMKRIDPTEFQRKNTSRTPPNEEGEQQAFSPTPSTNTPLHAAMNAAEKVHTDASPNCLLNAVSSIIPPIAQLELHLILHRFEEIAEVYIRTVKRPKWKKVFGGLPYFTQIDVIPFDAEKKPSAGFVEELKRWSFMKEFNTDVNISLTCEVPESATSLAGRTEEKDANSRFGACYRVYTPEDGKMLRSMTTFHGITLANSLGYNDPLVDENNCKPYEPYGGTI